MTIPCQLSATPYPIYFLSYAPYLEPFLHPQPEDAPRFGDSDPFTRDIKQGMTFRGHASGSTIFDTVTDGSLRQCGVPHVHRLPIRLKYVTVNNHVRRRFKSPELLYRQYRRVKLFKRSKYMVIQKDGLNFIRLYFLNYTRYVNDLHNI